MKLNIKLVLSNLIVRPTFRESVMIWIQSRRIIDRSARSLFSQAQPTRTTPRGQSSPIQPMLDITSVGP